MRIMVHKASIRTRRFRLVVVLVGAVLAGLMVFPYISLIAPRSLRDRVYRTVTYMIISDGINESQTESAESLAKLLNTYVHEHTFSVSGYTKDTSYVLDNFVSGFGLCFDQSLALVTLAHHVGMEGRTRMLGGTFTHSVAELWIDGRWRYFDPFYGMFMIDEAGGLATASALRPGNTSSAKAMALALYSPGAHATYFGLQPLGTWGPFSSKIGTLRKSIDYIVRFSVITTRPALEWYQDMYLSGWNPDERSIAFFSAQVSQDDAFTQFYRARQLHLWQRTAEAREIYEDVWRDGTSELSDDALYFLGRAHMDEGAFAASSGAFRRLLEEFPESHLVKPATYWLGLAYEKQGNLDLARDSYNAISGHEGLDASVRLMMLDKKEKNPRH